MTDNAPRCEAGPCDEPATFESTEQSRLGPTIKKWCLRHRRAGDVPLDEAGDQDGPTDEMLQRAIEIPRTHPRPQTHEADDE